MVFPPIYRQGNTMLRAKEKDLRIWSAASGKARYDYDSDEYLISEMLNKHFFGNCHALLTKGDQIFITDAEDQIIVVRVDFVDRRGAEVWLSKMERIYAHPVVELRDDVPDDPGLTYRWRPVRAGGHSIVTALGEVVAIQFSSREEAEQAIHFMYESKSYEPPHGHEPTSQFVKESKVFKQGRETS